MESPSSLLVAVLLLEPRDGVVVEGPHTEAEAEVAAERASPAAERFVARSASTRV